MLKDIDLTNKCGSCCHFNPIEDTATGECLQNPYNDSVVHDPKHPHWIVPRSRIKCPLYNEKPQTNADRIRAMSDEELAEWINDTGVICNLCAYQKECDAPCSRETCIEGIAKWLQQPAKEVLVDGT